MKSRKITFTNYIDDFEFKIAKEISVHIRNAVIKIVFTAIAAIILTIITILVFEKSNNLMSILDESNIAFKDFPEKYQYRLQDNFYNHYWDELRLDSSGLIKLAALNQSLHDSDSFEYYEFDYKGLYIYKDSFNGNSSFAFHDDYTFENDYVDIAAIKSVLVGKEYVDKHFLILESGRSFDKEQDFYFDYEIPVILGSNYSNYYQLGDTITVIYFGKEMTAHVIGFLEPDSFLEHENIIMNIDSFLVAPLQCFAKLSPFDTEEGKYQQRILLAKNSGSLNSDLNLQEVQNAINMLCNEIELSPSYSAYGNITLKMHQNIYAPYRVILNLSMQVFCILLTILVALLVGQLISKLTREAGNFSIKKYLQYLCIDILFVIFIHAISFLLALYIIHVNIFILTYMLSRIIILEIIIAFFEVIFHDKLIIRINKKFNKRHIT